MTSVVPEIGSDASSVGDAASVGLNWHSRSLAVQTPSQYGESNHGRLKKPILAAPNGAFLFHLVRMLGRKLPQAVSGRHDVA